MEIGAEIRLIDSGSLKAYVTLLIDNEIAISGFKVCETKQGALFVAAPSHKGKNAEGVETYYDDVRFIGEKDEGSKDSTFGRQCKEFILAQYQKQVVPKRGGGSRGDDRNAAAGRAHASSSTNAASSSKPEVAETTTRRLKPSAW